VSVMNKPSILERAREAIRVFKKGYPAGAKSLPFAWPTFRELKPQWHLINLQTYIDEGFTLNSLVYSAIMFKVRAVIPAPLCAYTGDPDYPEKLPPEHPLTKLVTRPNSHQSWTEFQSQNAVYLNLDGNVFIYKDRVHKEMYSLRPDRVYIVPNKGVPASIKGYLYVREGSGISDGLPILPGDMIHIKLPHPGDPLEGMGYGLSPLSPAAQCADIDNMITKFINLFFQRGSMLTGVLSFDVPLKEPVVDVILDRWKKKYGGHDKWGVGVLDRGGTYSRVGLTFEEMGFHDQDARSECRILGPFGVPPALIGSRVGLESTNYSVLEGYRKAVWEDTLVPELRLFEVEYQHHLKTSNGFVKYDLSQVPALQKELPTVVNAAFTLWQMGVPANQALAAVGLRIGKVPGGDVPYTFAGRGQGQGPHVGVEEGWGMRSLTCQQCGGEVKLIEGGLLKCSLCERLYALSGGNGSGEDLLLPYRV